MINDQKVINGELVIEDGVKRECHDCGNITFHYDYDGIISCNCCYTKWQPLRAFCKLIARAD